MNLRLPMTLLLAAAAAGSTFAQDESQPVRRCASAEYLQQQLAADPAMRANLEKIEQESQAAMNAASARTGNPAQTQAIVTIPVVFHVIYRVASENISNTRLQEQITVLNEDYSKTNADASLVPSVWQSIAADCQIQFCLAQRDPNGGMTDGMLHVQTTHLNFPMTNDSMKFDALGGDDAWDRSKYLNIWVCKLSGGILGYSTFPGGQASKDGVVLDYRYVGKTGAAAPYNKGRTATHEVGHWLNLYHIWGDDNGSCSGSDNCADTPNQGAEHYGCYTAGSVQTDNCSTTSPGTMWMNYMDYTDDACMYMFTAGQKARMSAVMSGSRASLATSNGCTPVGLGPDEQRLNMNLNVYPSPTSGAFSLNLGYLDVKEVDVMVYNTVGAKVIEKHVTEINNHRVDLDLTGKAPGMYFVEVRNGSDRAIRKLMLSGN